MSELKERRKVWPIVLAAVALVFAGVWLALSLAAPKPSWRWEGSVYTNDDLSLKFLLPEGWEARDARELGRQSDQLSGGGASMAETYQLWTGSDAAGQAVYLQVVPILDETDTEQATLDTLSFYGGLEGVEAVRLENLRLAGADYGVLALTSAGEQMTQLMLVRMAEKNLVNLVLTGGAGEDLTWSLSCFDEYKP